MRDLSTDNTQVPIYILKEHMVYHDLYNEVIEIQYIQST